jgi:tetratricopeptide (TPR) repeat protein
VNDQTNLERLRQWAAYYWQPVLTVILGIPAFLKAAREFGLPISDASWVTVGCAVVLLVLVRFPAIAVRITLFLLGKPRPIPRDHAIFRSARPYTEVDEGKLPGRQPDLDRFAPVVRDKPFHILTGETGCGKTSFLRAALGPKLKEVFEVVRCSLIDGPLGAELARPRVSQDRFAETLTNLAQPAPAGTNPSSAPQKPILLCLDQFEQIFLKARDSVRRNLFAALREVVKEGRFRLLLIIRDDYLDLLLQACRDADPEQKHLPVTSYSALKAFPIENAKQVLAQMLTTGRPLDPGQTYLQNQFIEALVMELARPPRDRRLSQEDEKTVLPVELQMVGLALERFGEGALSVEGLRSHGGKAGLLRNYLDDAIRIAAIQSVLLPDQALAVLRALVSPARSAWTQTLDEIAGRVNLPRNRVEAALRAFADDFYLVAIQPAQTSADGAAADTGASYRLLHDHLARVLVETPHPVLRRQRDREERLRFWMERDQTYFEAIGTQSPPAMGGRGSGGPRPSAVPAASRTGRLRAAYQHVKSFFQRVRLWFAQPVPVLECLSLWKHAPRGDARRVLRRSLWGFGKRVAVLALIAAVPTLVWWRWIQSDEYQVRRILADAAVVEAWHQTSSQSRTDENNPVFQWVLALIDHGQVSKAIETVEWISNDNDRARLMALVANALAKAGLAEESRSASGKAINAARDSYALEHVAAALAEAGLAKEASAAVEKIRDNSHRSKALTNVAVALAKAGLAKEASAAAEKIQDNSDRSKALAAVAEPLAEAGLTPEVRAAARRAMEAAESIQDDLDRSRALTDMAAALAKAGLANEALDIAIEIPRDSDKTEAFTAITATLSRAGSDKKNVRELLDRMRKESMTIRTPSNRSKALATNAKGFASLRVYREARLICEECIAIDKLDAYAVILKEYSNDRRGVPPGLFHVSNWASPRAASPRVSVSQLYPASMRKAPSELFGD